MTIEGLSTQLSVCATAVIIAMGILGYFILTELKTIENKLIERLNHLHLEIKKCQDKQNQQNCTESTDRRV